MVELPKTQVIPSKLTALTLFVNHEGLVYSFFCVNHHQTFSLNKIPMSTCTIAVGREVKSGGIASVHDAQEVFKYMNRAQVFLDIEGFWGASGLAGDRPGETGLWGLAGRQVIFDGLVTGISFQKSHGKLQVTVQLIHWLADLAFSSIFSAESHPQNPSQFSNFSTYKQPGTGSLSPHLLASRRFSSFFSANNIQADLWGSALGQMLCQISNESVLQIGPPTCGGGGTPTNEFALRALNRIEGLSGPCMTTDSTWAVPLSLEGLRSVGSLVAKAMSRYIGGQSMASWWHTTIWDKLVGDLAPAFMFHIVPRVQTALVVPFVPGLGGSVWTSLVDATEMATLNINSFVRRPIRAVGIYSGVEYGTAGLPSGQPNVAKALGIGGCYFPEPDARGTVLIRRAPGWMSSIPAAANSPAKTMMGREPGGSRKATGMSMTPGRGNLSGDSDNRTSMSAAADTSELFNNLAHYIYITEVLRGRTGVITGKLRFDIAPGSTINFSNYAGGLAGLRPQTLNDIYVGSVIRVESVLDAERQVCGTTLHLSHVRTKAESEDPRFSVESHPMYDQVFAGAPLIDEYNFGS